jgi:hypothetical protein
MSHGFLNSSHAQCPDCGASIPKSETSDSHVCDEERKVEFQFVELRPGVDRLEADIAGWLGTPQGQFAQWLAERPDRAL